MTKVTKLLSKTTQFNSTNLPGYTLTNKRFYTNNINYPIIEEQIFKNKEKSVTKYVSMRRPNGIKFEVLEHNGDFLKILKDRFGKILSYKSNMNFNASDIERIYKNTAEIIRSMIQNFLI